MRITTLFLGLACAGTLTATPVVDEAVFGKMLGGWKDKKKQAASYEISGSEYRTWKPHVTASVDGGIYVSVRIDHMRGMLASDDHASLELTFDKDGNIDTARSTISLQGRKVSSDLIRSGGKVGGTVIGADRAVKVGTDLIADLSAKLMNENVSEPGRVGFPAALRHNYNLLCLSVRNVDNKAVPTEIATPSEAIAGRAVPVDENGEPVPMPVPGDGPPSAETSAPAAGREASGKAPETVAPNEGEKPAAGEPSKEDAAGAGSGETGRKAPPLDVHEPKQPK